MTGLDLAVLTTGAVAILGGLLAVTTRQVVHAALWLVVALLGVAGTVLVLGAELVSLVLVVVYVGAIVVLVLFALMLTRAPIGPDRAHAAGWWRAGASAAAGVAVSSLLLMVLVPRSGGWPGRPVTARTADSSVIARDLFTTWVWPFEGLSVLLLAALVGALALAGMDRADR